MFLSKNFNYIMIIIAIIAVIYIITRRTEKFTQIGKVFSFHSNPQPTCNSENNCFGGSYVRYGFGGNPQFNYDVRKRKFKMSLK